MYQATLYILNSRNEVQQVKTRGEALEQGRDAYYVIVQKGQIYYDFWNQGFYSPENNLREILAHLEWMEKADERAYQEWLVDADEDKCGFSKQDFSIFIMLPASDRLRKILMRHNGRAKIMERPYCLDKQGKADLDTAALRHRHKLSANATRLMDVLAKEGHEAALELLRHLEEVEDNKQLAEKLGIDIQDISAIQHRDQFKYFCHKEYPEIYEAYMKQRFDSLEF